jgi:ABC-2 type transport system permease protein
MHAFLAFSKKELLEISRTHKLLIFICVFLVLGLMNPLIAKLTPELLEALMPEGFVLQIPAPTALDSWTQFYKNVPQLGLIVLIIVFSGSISGEVSGGTLILVLTKGLPRPLVILSKYLVSVLIWTLSLSLSFWVTDLYTRYFWSGETLQNLVFSAFCLWCFGVLLLAVTIFGGVLFSRSVGSLLFTAGFVGILFILGIFPSSDRVNPLLLVSKNVSLLTAETAKNTLTSPLLISAALIAVFLSGALILFNKKRL